MLDADTLGPDNPISGNGYVGPIVGGVPSVDLRDNDAIIARLEAQLAEQAAALAHSRKIFERASAVARIGVWECSLPDETLTWTDSVYDLFEIPRGAPIDRSTTLRMYSEESLRTLNLVRTRAIAERAGFQFDAEIVTARGRRRWMRLTATVECEGDRPVRIFGMKQDITEEKILADRTRYLAEFDVMTGLANRGVFQAGLAAFDAGAAGSLLLIDLDGFKRINDTFGHARGDECLKDAAACLRSVCADADLVARIGGDEFAVLLGPQVDADTCAALAGTIVAALRQPVEHCGERLVLGASIGIAHAPCSASELFTRADTALYTAKAAGRNTFRAFEPLPPRAAAVPGGPGGDRRRRATDTPAPPRIAPSSRIDSE